MYDNISLDLMRVSLYCNQKRANNSLQYLTVLTWQINFRPTRLQVDYLHHHSLKEFQICRRNSWQHKSGTQINRKYSFYTKVSIQNSQVLSCFSTIYYWTAYRTAKYVGSLPDQPDTEEWLNVVQLCFETSPDHCPSLHMKSLKM